MTPEVSCEVRLIVEADAHSHLRHGLPVEEAASCGVDPAPHEVAVRWDPEGMREAPHEMRRRHVEDPPRLGQGDGLEAVLIEEIPEIGCDLAVGAFDRVGGSLAKM